VAATIGETDHGEQFERTLSRLTGGHERCLNVRPGAQCGNEIELLEDKADGRETQRGKLTVAQGVKSPAEAEDRSR
jgi:hypothetical protein